MEVVFQWRSSSTEGHPQWRLSSNEGHLSLEVVILLPRAIEPFIEGQIIFATQMPRQQKKLPEHYTHQAKPKRSKINHRLNADFKQ